MALFMHGLAPALQNWAPVRAVHAFVQEQGIDATVTRIREVVGDNRCYITFDIDCLDPAYAPGTGTPVCGGLSTWQAKEILRRLGGIDLVGMDVVEVAPPFDHAEITSLAGATLALELICLFARVRTPS